MDRSQKDVQGIFPEQDGEENDKPPSPRPRPWWSWRIAVIANSKGESTPFDTLPPDAGAEYDKPETIQAIRSAIESDGHLTRFLNADARLPEGLRKYSPDICFNIAEGLGGDAREAQVPALLEMLKIPYTASRVLANALALDKSMTKRIWQNAGLPTAPFQELISGKEPLQGNLNFPLIIKPAREGTGMGMTSHSIVFSEAELRKQAKWVIRTYRQPALVETYLPGREFTVAVLGRPGAAFGGRSPKTSPKDGFHRLPVLEIDNQRSVTPGLYGYLTKTLHFGDDGIPGFICPAHIGQKLKSKLQDTAIKAHLALGALDVSRVDFRLDENDNPFLIEINTLPGLSPGFSDLCLIAAADGWAYEDLILEILYLGASRFGLVFPPSSISQKKPYPIRIRDQKNFPIQLPA